MKSRLQPAMTTLHQRRLWRYFWLVALLLVGLAGVAFAQDSEDPPARVGYVSFRQGGVVLAPQGDDEWTDLPANRPITAGDRLWTDRGARAELQVGTSTLHMDGESHLGVSELEERALKVILQQGSVNLRVREVSQGENVEVDTPNLAVRALQPGDYRIDVDPRSGETRVTVQSGLVSLFGESGESIQMGAGQNASFGGRALAQVQGPGYRVDDFGLWAADRNAAEDQSVTARYVPRGVVGYAQLDQYGTWSQDPTYGAVWYPTVQVANWAPYRYGHWDWIGPWGWTWVDDAPWGFAPFHYGRWTMVANRWCWVPGRLATRPVYAPALVVFLGGGGAHLAIGSGPAVGWYPLAPGEAWWPVFRHSPRYLGFANFNIDLGAHPRNATNHFWRNRPFAVTAVGEDDFRRGRPVYRHWQPLAPQAVNQSIMNVVPVRPELRHRGDAPRPTTHLQAIPPGGVQSAQPATMPPRFFAGREAAPAPREQFRGRPEVPSGSRDALRAQREQAQRQQQELARRQAAENALLLQRMQQERAARLQQLREQQQNAAVPVRPFPPPVRPFAQGAPQQAVPVPQQQVRPVQQGEHGWQRRQLANGEPVQPGAVQGNGGWQGARGHWR